MDGDRVLATEDRKSRVVMHQSIPSANIPPGQPLGFGTYSRDFLKLSFHMFPYNEISKVFNSKLWIDIFSKHSKIPLNIKFEPHQSEVLGVTSI